MLFRRLFGGFLLGGAAYASYPKVLNWMAVFMAHTEVLSPERAHELFIKACELGILPNYTRKWPDGKKKNEALSVELWGKKISTPVGLAAGMDKDARAMDSLFNLGFGFVEVGSVTPKPQPGNPRPRVFRLVEDRAIINRYGFNSSGLVAVKERLISWRKLHPKNSDYSKGLLGVNLGKNKSSTNAIADYIEGISELGKYADYLVINISSPNTPGLRAFQNQENMEALLSKVNEFRRLDSEINDIPLLIKIDPDITQAQKESIAKLSLKYQIDGIIVTNTTVTRPEYLKSKYKIESGGLSGRPLKDLSLTVLRDMYKLTGGKVVLIGVGGIEHGEDAYKRIRAGASLVQLYSSIVFHGPEVVSKINKELEQCLKKDNFSNIKQVIGIDAKI